MLKIYSGYKCRTCKNEIILLTEQVEKQAKDNRYLACPYCNSKRLSEEIATDDLRECMNERKYKKVHGAYRQVE